MFNESCPNIYIVQYSTTVQLATNSTLFCACAYAHFSDTRTWLRVPLSLMRILLSVRANICATRTKYALSKKVIFAYAYPVCAYSYYAYRFIARTLIHISLTPIYISLINNALTPIHISLIDIVRTRIHIVPMARH